jgi:hypothetical protein
MLNELFNAKREVPTFSHVGYEKVSYTLGASFQNQDDDLTP